MGGESSTPSDDSQETSLTYVKRLRENESEAPRFSLQRPQNAQFEGFWILASVCYVRHDDNTPKG